MKKVITYGTYDLLHYGHIRLLERAKALGDYLIVGVTANDFDIKRGKINVQQSLIERIEAVKKTGLADEIIVEEYEGQKIDDIINYGIDIFTVGSDWEGQFDYLKEYCDVVYLDRTEGISSSKIRSSKRVLKLGIVGDNDLICKTINESKYVNGLEIVAMCTTNNKIIMDANKNNIKLFSNYDEMLNEVDAVYVVTNPITHFEYIKEALEKQKHVLCETPISMVKSETENLYNLAKSKGLVLMEAIKTAYSPAFNRMILLAKMGVIGDIISIDSTCTSLEELENIGKENLVCRQNSMCAWSPIAILPVFVLLGTNYKKIDFVTYYLDKNKKFDLFTKINLNYNDSTATIKVGKGVKSEGELIISGTKGYIYVPAPWWKTEYFELRYEDTNKNKRYFYQLDGEGIRHQLVTFIKMVEKEKENLRFGKDISVSISNVINKYNDNVNLIVIEK